METRFDFTGRVAVVTGGGQGIGRAVASSLATAGARVLIVDTECAHSAEAVARIEAAGGVAAFVEANVSRPESALTALARAKELWGGVHVLVNNAGQYPFAPALQVSEGQWDHVLNVNLKGAFLFARAAAAQMIDAGQPGAIVNVSSIHAISPMTGFAAYGVSKAGLSMLTRSLASELGRFGIRVNSVAPGGIHTPGSREAGDAVARAFAIEREKVVDAYTSRVPLGRMGDPDEVAGAVLFLASSTASYITGANLVIDGGYTLS